MLSKLLSLLLAKILLCNAAAASATATLVWNQGLVWVCIRIIYFVYFSTVLSLMFAKLSFDHDDIIAICGSLVAVLVTYLPILYLSHYPYLFFTVPAFTSHSYTCQSLSCLLFVSFLVFILFLSYLEFVSLYRICYFPHSFLIMDYQTSLLKSRNQVKLKTKF